jgi:asparagine synthase (glutamine-hydrolysing)
LSFFCKIGNNPSPFRFSLEKNFRFESLQITYNENVQIIDNEADIFIFSGEIFNLEFLHNKFKLIKSESASQTFYKGFLSFGDTFLNDAEGDFLFICFDKFSHNFTIARDHFGAKSIFIAKTDADFFISSDIRFLIKNVKLTINHVAISNYFDFGKNDTLITSMTFFNEVSEVLPGHVFKNNSSENQRQYWVPDIGKYGSLSESELIETFKNALIRSVNNRLKNNPLATNLSGGLDSSAITSISKMQGADVRSIYFETDIPETDETYFANIVIDKWQTEHQTVRKTKSQIVLANTIIESTGFPDQLFLTGTAFVSIAEELKAKGITQILTGEGGDAVVGYGFEYLENCIENNDWLALKNGIEGYIQNRDLTLYFKEWNSLNKNQKMAHYESYFLNKFIVKKLKNKQISEAFLVWKNAYKNLNISLVELLNKGFLSISNKIFKSKKTEHILNNKSFQQANFSTTFSATFPSFLQKQNDEFAACFSLLNYAAGQEQSAIYQSFGIACHHPFLNKDIMEISLAIATETKFNGGKLRGGLRLVMEGILPEEVRQRTSKVSFQKYAHEQCLELLSDTKLLFPEGHKIWHFINKSVFERLKDNLAKTSLENSSKSQDIFITNRVIYLALWLDYLDKNSLANIRF